MYSLEFSSTHIVLAFNKDYFCLKCFFNSAKLQNLDIAVKLRHFTVDLCSCSYTNICCNRPFFSSSHAANVAFCFSMTSYNDERQSAIFCCSSRQGHFILNSVLPLFQCQPNQSIRLICNNSSHTLEILTARAIIIIRMFCASVSRVVYSSKFVFCVYTESY